jgi:hypothetical protein
VETKYIVLIIVAVVMVAALIAAYLYAKKVEKKQAEQTEQLKAAAQTISMLVIDKKRMKMKEAGLPAMVLESTPKYLRGMKVPVVKAKVGPRVMSLLCDEKVFPNVPVKKEVKAVVSGLYITEVKGIRGSVDTTQTEKKGFFAKFKKNK